MHIGTRCMQDMPVLRERERFLEANKKCGTHCDLGSAACQLPAEAGVGTVAEMVVEGVEIVIRLAVKREPHMSLGRRRRSRRIGRERERDLASIAGRFLAFKSLLDAYESGTSPTVAYYSLHASLYLLACCTHF